MKKTLFTSFFFPPEIGGIQTYLSGLIEHLPPEKVVVLAKNHPDAHAFDPLQKYTVYRTAFDSPLKYIKLSNITFYQELKQIVKKEEIEQLVLAHPLPLGISALYLKNRHGTPYSTFTHGSEITEALKTGVQKKLLQAVLQGADTVFCTTNFMKNILAEKLSIEPKKIAIVPPGITPPKKISKKATLKKYNLENKKIILTVSRLVKRKGHDIILEALPQLLKKIPNAHYLIVGDGPEKKNLLKTIQDTKLSKNVTLLSNIHDDELQSIYAVSDVFVMPSREISGDIEGFGIVYLEAAAHGLPALATKTGGIPEAVLQNKTGILLPAPPKESTKDYTKKTTEALEKLLKSKGTFGEKAQKNALEKYRWSIQTKKLKKYL